MPSRGNSWNWTTRSLCSPRVQAFVCNCQTEIFPTTSSGIHVSFQLVGALIGTTRYLASVYRKHQVDIVHCHSVYPTGYVAARCGTIAHVPLVITSHCGDVCPSSSLLRKPGITQRYERALQRANAVIAISDFTEERLRDLCPRIEHLTRIPNGVHVAKYASPVQRPEALASAIRSNRYFLFLGRLVHRKGVDLLLNAYAAADPVGQDHVVVGGDGPEKSSLEQQAADPAHR